MSSSSNEHKCIISFSESVVSGRNDVGSTRVGVIAKKGLSFGRGGVVWRAVVFPVTTAGPRLKDQGRDL